MSSKSILCLCRAPIDYFAGIPRYCLDFYSYIQNISVTYASPLFNIKQKSPQTFNVRTGQTFIGYPSIINIGTLFYSFSFLCNIIRSIHSYNLIHYQHPDPISALSLITILFKRSPKLIVTWHADVYAQYWFLSPFLLVLDLIVFLRSDRIIFLTPAHQKDSLIGRFSLFKKKSTIIPAVSNITTRPVRERQYPDKGTFRIISVGRLVPYKGYCYALNALARLDFDFHYTIIGSGPLYSELQSQIQHLKLSDRVSILQDVADDQKYQLLRDSHVFLFPSISKSEAYGLSQVEALYFSLPIVNTMLNNGVNYLVPPYDAISLPPKKASSLASALTLLFNSKDAYIYFSKRSSLRSLELSPVAINRKISDLLFSLL